MEIKLKMQLNELIKKDLKRNMNTERIETIIKGNSLKPVPPTNYGDFSHWKKETEKLSKYKVKIWLGNLKVLCKLVSYSSNAVSLHEAGNHSSP